MEILKHPFTIGILSGLTIGLILVLVTAINAWRRRRELDRELRTLREHLHTQMTITAQGNQAALQEIDSLKAQNENLRVTLAALKAKPDRQELRTLHIYDKAVHMMLAKAPGFAPAWESMLREAEAEAAKADTGLIAWVRNAIRPSLKEHSPAAPAETDNPNLFSDDPAQKTD